MDHCEEWASVTRIVHSANASHSRKDIAIKLCNAYHIHCTKMAIFDEETWTAEASFWSLCHDLLQNEEIREDEMGDDQDLDAFLSRKDVARVVILKDWLEKSKAQVALCNDLDEIVLNFLKRGKIAEAADTCKQNGEPILAAIILGGHYDHDGPSRRRWRDSIKNLLDSQVAGKHERWLKVLIGQHVRFDDWRDALWMSSVCALDRAIERYLSGSTTSLSMALLFQDIKCQDPLFFAIKSVFLSKFSFPDSFTEDRFTVHVRIVLGDDSLCRALTSSLIQPDRAWTFWYITLLSELEKIDCVGHLISASKDSFERKKMIRGLTEYLDESFLSAALNGMDVVPEDLFCYVSSEKLISSIESRLSSIEYENWWEFGLQAANYLSSIPVDISEESFLACLSSEQLPTVVGFLHISKVAKLFKDLSRHQEMKPENSSGRFAERSLEAWRLRESQVKSDFVREAQELVSAGVLCVQLQEGIKATLAVQ